MRKRTPVGTASHSTFAICFGLRLATRILSARRASNLRSRLRRSCRALRLSSTAIKPFSDGVDDLRFPNAGEAIERDDHQAVTMIGVGEAMLDFGAIEILFGLVFGEIGLQRAVSH